MASLLHSLEVERVHHRVHATRAEAGRDPGSGPGQALSAWIGGRSRHPPPPLGAAIPFTGRHGAHGGPTACTHPGQDRRRVGQGRGRRIAIVALTRKLLIAPWRYATQGVVPTGAAFKAEAIAPRPHPAGPSRGPGRDRSAGSGRVGTDVSPLVGTSRQRGLSRPSSPTPSSMRDHGPCAAAPTGCEVMRPSRSHGANGLAPRIRRR
jgi:hypothetical protein